MQISIIHLPKDLKPQHLKDHIVVVFDVLRATTTIVTAIASGAKEVRVFDSLDAATKAAAEYDGAKLLAGERQCLPPPECDLGNSPGDYTAQRVAGKTIFLSTTNGTRAIVAAKGAAKIFVAGLVNATATGVAIASLRMDVTLLCSGTDGETAPEDIAGAEMVDHAIQQHLCGKSPTHASPADILVKLRQTQGGQNITRAGLDRDIEFASQVDKFDIIVEVTGDPPIARKMQ